ncbi:hypothetical protein WJ542_14280 [Paraburkholderia sp. B3]|uniref:hypothetical protein n=1 Tax=Paraburkholderia sp. B3 TaxID=3134791 RepID=UPI003982A435
MKIDWHAWPPFNSSSSRYHIDWKNRRLQARQEVFPHRPAPSRQQPESTASKGIAGFFIVTIGSSMYPPGVIVNMA